MGKAAATGRARARGVRRGRPRIRATGGHGLTSGLRRGLTSGLRRGVDRRRGARELVEVAVAPQRAPTAARRACARARPRHRDLHLQRPPGLATLVRVV